MNAISPEPILARLELFGIRLGLDNVRAVLAALGDPQRGFPSALVAGSNGKGSTSALLAAMASAAGYRTGLYTSPHLEIVEERLRIDGRVIPSPRLGTLLAEAVETAERETGTPPTYFEALTVAAFRWFAQERVDLAVVEVGMGGRLDATNTCEPLLSLITSISLEHREHLGDTLAAIAGEKAGILRRGRPALAWAEEPEADRALREAAAAKGAALRSAPELVTIEAVESRGWEGQRVRLATPARRYDLRLSLLGRHQAHNLGLAVLAAETLSEIGFGRLDERAVAAGAAAGRWPGRLESVSLPDGRRVVLDAAHNPEGAGVLADFLAGIDGPVDLLFGVLADKDAPAMLGRLAPRVRHAVLTAPASPRARDPRELAALLAGRVSGVAEVETDSARALDRAVDLGGLGAGGTLAACGSIVLVGEVRRALRERFGTPPPPVYISGS
ncbi:MAG TPA: Mur ligase family protein [Thermoanaerobaculia bacterium]|nr:Mur ligase family protein [Thermoanaerobaculia bacterium]